MKPDNTRTTVFFTAVLVLSSLACGQQIMTTPTTASASTPTRAASPSLTAPAPASPDATEVVRQQAQVLAAAVNVHKAADVESAVVGYVYAGMDVSILSCDEDYCNIEQPFGYVWRGCLSDNPNGLKCEAKQ